LALRRFPFANHDGAVDIDLVKHNAHGVNGSTVGGIFVAATQPLIASQRRCFGHAGKLDGKFTFHEVLVQVKEIARSLTGAGGGMRSS
jgi:hypothetical protein